MHTLPEHIETSLAFMEDRSLDAILAADPELIAMAEILAEDLGEAYADNLMRGLPYLGTVDVWQWLCQTYCQHRNKVQLKRCATKVLQAYSYRISLEDSQVIMNATQGLSTVGVVDALMYLASVAGGEQKTKLGQEYKAWVKTIYLIVNGNMAGFELKY
jgi:hypothetical protein